MAARANLDLWKNNYASAISNANLALELAPSGSYVLSVVGWVKIASGQAADGVELMKRAMRTMPFHPQYMPIVNSHGLMMLGRYEEAKSVARGLLAAKVTDPRAHPVALGILASTAVWEGKIEEAQKYAARAECPRD